MKRYSQQNQEWKGDVLGFGSETIGSSGCLLTCLSIAYSYYNIDKNPKILNNEIKNAGGFDGSLLIVRMSPNIRVVDYILCDKTDAPIDVIKKYMSSRYVVIVCLDSSIKTGFQQHWVVLDKYTENDFIIIDPYPVVDSENVSLVGRYGFAGDPKKIITSVFVVEAIDSVYNNTHSPGDDNNQQPNSETIKSGDVVKIVATAGVNLRNSDNVILTVLDTGTELVVGENTIEMNGLKYYSVSISGYIAQKDSMGNVLFIKT